MSLGALAGGGLCLGVLLVVAAWRGRRPTLSQRVTPYVHHRGRGAVGRMVPGASRTVGGALGDLVVGASRLLETMGSSSASIRRRLARSGTTVTVEEVRLQQLVWAGAGAVLALLLGLLAAALRPVSLAAVLVLALVAAAAGAAGRDWWLTRTVRQRQARVEAQLPDVVELLALVVSAGQGPVAALERVVALGRGDLVDELAMTLADVRSGTVLSTALQRLGERAGSVPVGRLAEAVSVALERGTPLAEVLRAQAADAREASRRGLMEEGGRREIAQMVPVVFLILPVTVLFALFPGLTVLRLGL